MLTLYIGNRNYSSWSLRAWLLMRQAGIDFEERMVRFSDPEFAAKIVRLGAPPRVPVLVDDGFVVWDSIAIAEYLAERFPQAGVWPAEQRWRARARSVCAEMHAGFAALRQSLPMNIEAHLPGVGAGVSAEAQRDVERLVTMWGELRGAHAGGGRFLFGNFCAADAFYAPVVSRLLTYEVSVPAQIRDYMEAIMDLGAMREWCDAARAEHDFLPDEEPYRKAPD